MLCFPDRDDENLHILLEELLSATVSVELAMFTLTLPEVVDVLQKHHNLGVRVRAITDFRMGRVHRGQHVQKLRSCGIKVRTNPSDDAQMHHKFCVIDGRTVMTGSFNWTRQAEDGNRENLIIFRETNLATSFSSEFDAMWEAFASR